MSTFTAETQAKMAEYGKTHGLTFAVRRITGQSSPQFDCLVRDGLSQVVATGTGYDRDEAFADACSNIDFSSVNSSPAQMAAELKVLRAEVGDAVAKAVKKPRKADD